MKFFIKTLGMIATIGTCPAFAERAEPSRPVPIGVVHILDRSTCVVMDRIPTEEITLSLASQVKETLLSVSSVAWKTSEIVLDGAYYRERFPTIAAHFTASYQPFDDHADPGERVLATKWARQQLAQIVRYSSPCSFVTFY
jgi:hypothetical protein